MKATIIATAVLFAAAGCAPARTTFARYPGAAPTWDRAKQDPKAVEIADKVVAAAGGMDKWNTVKQLKWTEKVMNDGKVVLEGEEAWDRWNARHYGRLLRSEGNLVVMRELYGEQASVYGEGAQGGPRQKLPPADAAKILPIAVDRFQFDTSALCMAFLLEEPGTTLAFVGQAQGDVEGKPLDVIKVTFDAAEKARAGSSYQVDVDPETHMIARIEIIKPGGNVGYKLAGWKDVNGMKFPTQQNNIGYAGEVITYAEIQIGEPQDSLFTEQLH